MITFSSTHFFLSSPLQFIAILNGRRFPVCQTVASSVKETQFFQEKYQQNP